jgi:tetratricopeptide (TPR) repeat protein
MPSPARELNDEAIAAYRTLLDTRLEVSPGVSPHYRDGWQRLSHLLFFIGRIDEAMPLLTGLVQLQPGDAQSHYNLGRALDRQGRPNDALPQFEAAVRWKPDYVDAHVAPGRTLMDLARTPEAIAHFSEAEPTDPGSGAGANLRRALSARDGARKN